MIENILISVKNSILTITVNRPDKLNALNKKTVNELNQILILAEKDITIKAVIITGSGEKSFVSGADISEFIGLSIDDAKQLSKKGQDLLFKIESFKKPVIAAINGFALGGGLELAMACHLRVASDNAKMGLPEVSLGVIPGYGGTQRLAQLVGKGKAYEMIMTADMITSDEALAWGLVNHVTTQDTLMIKCLEVAENFLINQRLK